MYSEYLREHHYSHSYAVYKKLTTLQIGPLDLQSTSDGDTKSSSKARDTIIKEIYESNYNEQRVIKEFKLDGLYYSLKYLEYDNFKLIFMEDDFSTILVNFIPIKTENFPRNEKVCTWKVPSTFIHNIDPSGFNFEAINTWKPFMEFNEDFNRNIPKSSQNYDFWSDVDNFIHGKPSKGIYEYIQFGSLIIVYSYKKLNDDYKRITKTKSESPYRLIIDKYFASTINL